MPSPVHPYSDYGVALRTLRSARSWLGFFIVFCVLVQFVGFALVCWTSQPYKAMRPQLLVGPPAAVSVGPTTEPSVERPLVPNSLESQRLNIRDQWNATYTMAVPVSQLVTLISVSSQTIIMFVTLLVVLIAQAPGVTQLTKSLIWSILLLFMFLPWQSFFAKDFPIPGVIYGYNELLRMIGPIVAPEPGHLPTRYTYLLVYLRFVGWPLLGLFVLLVTSERFRTES